MDKHSKDNACNAPSAGYVRRASREVRIGPVVIGGGNPVAVQSMTDTDTNNTAACVEQIGRIYGAGGRIVRLTAQGVREAENLKNIAGEVAVRYPGMALVADIHFLPAAALMAARHVDKVRINPGNYNDGGGDFRALLTLCRERGVALRIGVNHGSLAERIVSEWGDTPKGMVVSAMEFLRECRAEGFDQVVVSMKSSNTRVMVHAYRLLAAEMAREEMDFPIHLGVTEAGNGAEGRIKSAVGIGALLADGIGDTVRVSLTEPPESEIPVAQTLVRHFSEREAAAKAEYYKKESNKAGILSRTDGSLHEENFDRAETRHGEEEYNRPVSSHGGCGDLFNPYEYSRRQTDTVGRLGGGNAPLLLDELNDDERAALQRNRIAILDGAGSDPVNEWRCLLAGMDAAGDRRPVILRRKYYETDDETLAIKAAADFGVMFIDGLADGMAIENDATAQETLNAIALDILQASRARVYKADFIACPGCGRTLFGLQDTLAAIKERTAHLTGLRIGVMGCIVNGPGEMADADYGYVGAGPGRISLYRGRELIRRAIPQEEALDALITLIRQDGRWRD